MKRTIVLIAVGLLTAVGGVLVWEGMAPRSWVLGTPATVPAATPAARALGDQFARIAKAVSPAVVHIRATQVIRTQPMPSPFFDDPLWRRFFGDEMPPQQPREYRRQGVGSGIIVSEDGYILTNNHVVAGSTELTVKLTDGGEYKGQVVGTDPPTELALVKIDAEGLPVAPLGDSDKIEVGHVVLAIGNPFGLDRTVTDGIISAKGRSNVDVAQYRDFIQTSAPINPGNSGGPLVNLDGEVVGVNTAIFSQGGGGIGIGFAIPINMAKRVMEDLKGPKHRVTRAWLGIGMGAEEMSQEKAQELGLEKPRGVLVAEVFKGGPAQKAGLKQNDVILAIEGKPVNNSQQLALRVAEAKPGATVAVTVWRDKKELKVPVTLVERTEEVEAQARGAEEVLGLRVQDLTDELAGQLGVTGEKGVVVAAVQRDGPAVRAGLRPGDLIQEVGREKVSSVAEFRARLAKLDVKQGVVVLYRRRDTVAFTVIRP